MELDPNIRNNINEYERTGSNHGPITNDRVSALIASQRANNEFSPFQREMMTGREHTTEDREMREVEDNEESKDYLDRQLK